MSHRHSFEYPRDKNQIGYHETAPRKIVRFISILSLFSFGWIIWGSCLLTAADLPETGMDLYKITLQKDADLAQMKASIEAQGGKALTMLPEGKLVASFPSNNASALAKTKGAKNIELLSRPRASALAAPSPAGKKGLGARRNPSSQRLMEINKSFKKIIAVASNELSQQRALLEGVAALPTAVDNSISQYFPPIGDQGAQGSCTAWAACYYYNTYTQAMDEGSNPAGGDTNIICSPAFMYNLINEGVDNGGWTDEVVANLSNVGCCSWALMPYSETDYITWPTEAAWINSLRNRTSTAHIIGQEGGPCTDDDLLAIKQMLSNGYVLATDTDVYNNWYLHYPANDTGINNGVLYANADGLAGGHAIPIVGYDDNKSYYDGTTTQSGAFLIANSWGTWGVWNPSHTLQGFLWVAYKYFKNTSGCFGVAFYNDDLPRYRPRLYAVSGLNHTQRGYVTFRGAVGTAANPLWTSYAPISNSGGTFTPITDSKRVAVDLTNGIPSIVDFNNIHLFTQMTLSSSASGNGSITSAQFFHDLDGDGIYQSFSSPDPTITMAPGSTIRAAILFQYAQDALMVQPSAAQSAGGPQGGPFSPNSFVYTLTNTGAATLDWSAETTTSWLQVSQPSGSLSAGTSTALTVQITASANTLTSGVYNGMVAFTNTSSGNAQSCALKLTVSDGMAVTPSSGFVSRGIPGGPFSPSSLDYTIRNIGGSSINWTAAGNQAWFTVTPSSGTLASSGSAAITVALTAQAASLPVGTYPGFATFTNASSGLSTTRSVTLTVAPDYFTQLFSSADSDLAYHTLTLIPNGGSSFYQAFCAPATSFPTNPAGGTSLSLTNNSYAQVTLTGAQISLFGTSYSSFYVGSNGYITFGSGSSGSIESLSAHFSLPRISGLFDDLNPSSGSVTWKPLSDRVAVTYFGVPLYSGGGANNFQIEMFFDGQICITWLAITDTYGLAGVSRGQGLPAIFNMSDLTSYPAPIADGLAVSPWGGFAASGPAGGPFLPAGTTYTLTNNGAATLDWIAATTQTWLDVTPSSGALAPGASVIANVSINANANALALGVYSGALTFTNVTSGATVTRNVTLRVRGAASIPFAEGFESGALGPWWESTGTNTYRTLVTSSNVPHTGSYHLTMDSSADLTYARNELTLTVNLSNCHNVVLTFWLKMFGDEPHGPPATPFYNGADFDGVAISEDGVTWYEARGLRTLTSVYQQNTVDLDAAIAAHGMSYNSAFQIRFNHYDNYTIPTDGFSFDDIAITGINDALAISPKDDFAASGPIGGPFSPAGTTYTLTNNGATTLDWTATTTQPWLSVSPAGGSLGARASLDVVVSLTSGAVALPAGFYSGAVLFTNLTSGAQQSRTASLSIGQKNILAYVQYADMTASGEVANTFAAINSMGKSYARTDLTDYTKLAAALPGHDILLIAEQESATVGQLQTVGTAWASVLPAFVEGGGVVIQCDYLGKYQIIEIAGLMTLGGYASATGAALIVADPSDPVAQGVSNYSGASGTDSYTNADGNVVVRTAANQPVVINKSMGLGNVVAIGHDYFDTNANQTRVIGNAVFNLPARANALFISPTTGTAASGPQGGPFAPASMDYRLSNVSSGTIAWSAACDAWISVQPAGGSLLSGESTIVTVGYSASAATLVPGAYNGAVSFSDSTTTAVQTRSVALTVLDWMSVTPAGGFVASGLQGGPFSPGSLDYTLRNIGGGAMNWTAAGDQAWFTVTPSSGTLASSSSAAIMVSLNAQAAALPIGTYRGAATFTNASSGLITSRSVTLTVAPDYFTQLFSSPTNDLAYHTLTLIPNGGSSFYQAFCEAATSFPTDPAGGMALSLTNDSYAPATLTGAQVSLYGTAYSSFYVGSNGYITFGSGSSGSAESLSAHFSLPRISGLFDDLNPAAGSVTWKQLSDRAAVTYSNVPLYSGGGANSFQIEMFFDGKISITWLALTDTYGLAGVSRGQDVPANFVMSDLTSYPATIVDDLSISPKSSFTASGPVGGPFSPAGTTYTLTNNSTMTLAWTATTSQPWLSASPAGGSLGAGASVEVIVSLTSSAGALAAGAYSDTILFTNLSSGAQQSRKATLYIGQKNILAYVQYSDMSATGEVVNTFAAINSVGTNYTRTDLSDYTQLAAALPGHDTLLILEQETASVSQLQTVGTAWASVLPAFVAGGGVVIQCECAGKYQMIENAGLISLGGSADAMGLALIVADPADPVAQGVSNYTAGNASDSYVNSDGNVVIRTAANKPVVINKSIGLGNVVAIGHDYYASSADQNRVVGNAVFNLPALANALSVSPLSGFVASGPIGGPFYPSSTTYTLTNNSTTTLAWTAATTQPWLSVSPAAGSLGAGDSVNVIVSPTSAASALPTGAYNGGIRFTNLANGAQQTRTATLCVGQKNILAYIQYADVSGTGEVVNTFAAINSVGTNYTRTDLTDYTLLASALPGHDILLILEQETASVSQLQTVGTAWASILPAFVAGGGVVIQCECAGKYQIIENAGLISLGGYVDAMGLALTIADPSDPVAQGVSNYTAGNGSDSYLNSDGNVVVRTAANKPVVINKSIGLGNVVAIGHDYFASSADQNRVVGNAVFNLPAGANALSVSPVNGLAAIGPVGGPFLPAGTTYTLTNNGAAALNWTAATSQTWLDVTPPSGALAAGGSTVVTIAVNANANGLAQGVYSGALIFTNVTSGVAITRAVSLRIRGAASIPFFEGFESGALDPWWESTGTNTYRTLVTSANTPRTGSHHLTMDSSVSGSFARNELTLTVNLSSCHNVILTFWAKSFGDEPHGPPPSPFIIGADFDGVAISEDGVTWYEARGLRDLTSAYQQITIDLDAAIAAHGLSYNSTFQIRFNHYDDYPIATDGFAFDDIAITGTSSNLSVTPTDGLASMGHAGGPFTPAQKTFTLRNIGAAPLSWTAATTATWADLSASSGTLTSSASAALTVSANASANALPIGTYASALTVTDSGAGYQQTRPLKLTVSQYPEIWVAPTSFNERLYVGESTTRTLTIGNAGDAQLSVSLYCSETSRTVSALSRTLGMPLASRIPQGHDFTQIAKDQAYVPGEILMRFKPGLKTTSCVSGVHQ
ncbi:MAG: hypothetical protein NTX50_13785 [Candidatus Sumerlaeota bacterium]|nr:hypothetical protein [Candidatus Sumerlaeota bacterium]